MGKGGEIFVLDMGEPVKIVDLARDLVRLSGLPEDSIEMRYTGIRPGEKLYEELYFIDEQTLATAHPKLRAAYHRPYMIDEISQSIEELMILADGLDEAIRDKLREIVPEFEPCSASQGFRVKDLGFRVTAAAGKQGSACDELNRVGFRDDTYAKGVGSDGNPSPDDSGVVTAMANDE